MVNMIESNIEISMKKCIQIFKNNLLKIRTNRASPALLDGIYIEYYGKQTPLCKLSNIVVEDTRTLKVNLFDHSIKQLVEKSIMNSSLGLHPCSTGSDIRIIFPQLTENRRKELIKIVKNESEQSRIYIRNIRRDANEKIKKYVKEKIISEDMERHFQVKIQNKTNDFIKKIEHLSVEKEKELMII
ncbi:MAG TPA: ribosome recycling factor [Buchnera sp. (in: enterobacteria)]|nr:ribosome recycling factor [Buchnera sp. (in: enterobacteria)]